MSAKVAHVNLKPETELRAWNNNQAR